jgi:uncharacterized protein
MSPDDAAAALAPLDGTALLTTYRKDGTPGASPVTVVVDGDHAYFRTWSTTWKARRLRRRPEVRVAPCTLGGRPTGPAIRGLTRQLHGDEERRARRLLARSHPFLHGVLVPAIHRLRRQTTVHYELVPLDG